MKDSLNAARWIQPGKDTCFLSLFHTRIPLIFLLMGLTLMLRLLMLSGVAQEDEFTYAAMANALLEGGGEPLPHGFIIEWALVLPTALMYRLFGINDFSSLFFPVLISVVSLYFVWVIIRHLAGRRIAITVAALYAVFPLVSVCGTSIQPAVFLEFTTLLTGMFFLKAAAKTNPWGYMAAGVSAAVIPFSDLSGLLFLLLLMLYLLFSCSRDKEIRFKSTGHPGLIQAGLFLGAFLLTFTMLFMLQEIFLRQVFSDFFNDGEAIGKTIAPLQAAKAPGAGDFLFFILAFFKKQGPWNSDYMAGYGYVVFPAILYCLARKIKPSGVFIGWFLGYLALMTAAPSSLMPYALMNRSMTDMIVLILPMITICVIALKDLYCRSGIYGKTIAAFLFFLLPLASMINSQVLNSDLRNLSQERSEWTNRILAISGTGEANIYSADRIFPTWVRYYSGFSAERPVIIEKLQDIEKEGVLWMQNGMPEAQYSLNSEEKNKLWRQLPHTWKILAESEDIKLFKAGPLSPEEYKAIKSGHVVRGEWRLDLIPVDAERVEGMVLIDQKMTAFGDGWRNHNHLFMGADGPGGEVTFELQSEIDIRKNMTVGVTKAPDFGRLTLYLNGKRVLDEIDLYNGAVGFHEIRVGWVDLQEGRNVIRALITGKNPMSRGFRAGIDYIDIE